MSANLNNVYIRTHINGNEEEMTDWVLGVIGSNLAVEPGPNTHSSNQLWDLVFYKDSNTFCIFSKKYGKVMECEGRKLVLKDRDDSNKQLQEWKKDDNYLMMMQDGRVMHIEDEALILSERIDTQPLPSCQLFSIIFLNNVYIRTHINGYKETMKDWVLGVIGITLAVEPGRNTHSSNQLWDLVFCEDSKTFCILSKMYGKVMERAEQKLVLNYQDDRKKQLQEWKMDGNYLMMQDLVMHIDKEKALLTLSKRIVDTTPLPSCQQFSIISQIFYIKSYQNEINQEIVLDTEGRRPGSSVVPNVRNPSSDSQRWYLEYHLDGTFHIVSNIDRKVMECSEHQLVITDRKLSGGDNQTFKLDGDSRITTMQDRVLVVVYNNHRKCVFLEKKMESTSSTQPNQQFSFFPVV